MRKAMMMLTAVAALTACGEDAPESETVTVNFQLADYDTAFSDCEGTGGYSEIGSGTSVTVKNGDGEMLGTAKLGEGKSSTNGVQAAFCDWTVEIPDVPTGEKFYVVEVASRGGITSSENDLAADGWTFDVTLGEL